MPRRKRKGIGTSSVNGIAAQPLPEIVEPLPDTSLHDIVDRISRLLSGFRRRFWSVRTRFVVGRLVVARAPLMHFERTFRISGFIALIRLFRLAMNAVFGRRVVFLVILAFVFCIGNIGIFRVVTRVEMSTERRAYAVGVDQFPTLRAKENRARDLAARHRPMEKLEALYRSVCANRTDAVAL